MICPWFLWACGFTAGCWFDSLLVFILVASCGVCVLDCWFLFVLLVNLLLVLLAAL